MNERERGRLMGKALSASVIPFVLMAQSEQLDDVTIVEHAELFAPWDAGMTGKRGLIVQDEGKLYRALHDMLTPAQNGKPKDSPTIWQLIGDPGEEWPMWVQWIGVGDLYQVGSKVSHEGKKWVSTTPNNVWEPGAYGWEEVTT